MALYNFQRQFAPNVVMGLWLAFLDAPALKDREAEAAEARRLGGLLTAFEVTPETEPKGQTIRAHRKRHTIPGETLYLYTGCRSKQCVKLGEAVCKGVESVCLFEYKAGWTVEPAVRQGSELRNDLEDFAKADGFESIFEMMDWFEKTHGLPFTGELITW